MHCDFDLKTGIFEGINEVIVPFWRLTSDLKEPGSKTLRPMFSGDPGYRKDN